MNRRDFYRYGTIVLGNLVALVLAVPGVAYLLDPILNRKSRAGAFQTLATLSELKPGVPKSVAIIEERRDAWVKYPREPVGSVWLIRQPPCDKNHKETVLALSAECPHLGCAVNLGADGQSFFCPCHTSSFDLCGNVTNRVPPRPMDTLEVRLTDDSDPKVQVKFQRFRAGTEEKIPSA